MRHVIFGSWLDRVMGAATKSVAPASHPRLCSRAITGVSVVLLYAALACSGKPPEQQAMDRALAYFAQDVTVVDPSWANLFGYLHRRFGLEVRSAGGALLHEVPDGSARPELAAVYRRLVDPSAAVEKQRIADLPTAVDRITASALHCDRIPLPTDWAPILDAATEMGGYALTHAALAGRWTLENECLPWEALASLQSRQVDALERLVEGRDPSSETTRTPVDLAIEAAAMLHYLGAGSRVSAEAHARILAAQRPDGGWPLHPRSEGSDPHPTALALWVLLERLRPDAPPIEWVPPRP